MFSFLETYFLETYCMHLCFVISRFRIVTSAAAEVLAGVRAATRATTRNVADEVAIHLSVCGLRPFTFVRCRLDSLTVELVESDTNVKV